jgi:hypothetical protein
MTTVDAAYHEGQMVTLNKRRSAFAEFENMLRQNELLLCAQTAQRYRQSATDPKHIGYAQAGAKYFHDLVIVAAALYPSETGLRLQYQWAATGALRRMGVGYEHHAAMLQFYFNAARQILNLQPDTREALDTVERFMLDLLKDVFSTP